MTYISSSKVVHSTDDGDVPFAPMFHSGTWQEGQSGRRLAVHEPATGVLLGQVPDATAADVAAAYASAKRAQVGWARMAPSERGKLLHRVADAIEGSLEDLARLEATDSGNPVTAMRRDVAKGAEIFRHMAGLGYLLKGEVIPISTEGLHYTRRYPYGVVARIVAFNHPFLFACGRVASALVAGNAVLLKPSEHTPFAALALARITQDILPPGVLSVLTGGAELGAALTSHRGIERISFTGSVRTALKISEQAARSGHVKSMSFELGGKNPMVVLPDADPEKVAAAAVRGMNFMAVQGQSCGSTTRLFLHRDIAARVLEHLVPRVEAIRLGRPDDPDTEMGCLISHEARDRCLGFIEQGVRDGARVLAGGSVPDDPGLASGPYLRPTVLVDVPDTSVCATQEIFGPVLSVLEWSDLDDVVERANSLPYGLTAAVWTDDIRSALRVADALESGYVWINDVEFRHYAVPFGGWKDSGIGDEYGLDEPMSFTRSKTIVATYS
ncbi:aldehyde dehydrogenase family protein [Dactylosporangium roseum]|uniref:Aldehyde dehydrogenase family protein n=1 Tax=Dactylosporangium roseum TaxID=47989 RepID=A0ABY5ZB19_9ACTN|nr:aldehyde dehydrogenase family protein [Dactylosporangium roseum]UWZ39234.1 aldehyde dehydrogenase family protein [Dactylosporangium roseum]